MTVVEGSIPNVLSPNRPGSTLLLLFTERRMIVARTGISWAIIQGIGTITDAGLGRTSGKVLDMLNTMTPQEILLSHKKNKEIPHYDIFKVKLKNALTICSLKMFYSDGKKDHFEFPKPQYDQAKDLLRRLYLLKIETKP